MNADLLGTRRMGAIAKSNGQSREACPWADGARRSAWLEGWDSSVSPNDLVKAFPAGGPLLGGGV